MDLAMDLLKMSDYTTEDGYDARNYGNLEGLEEARALFADMMGVKSSEVCGRQLQPAADVITISAWVALPFPVPNPCPWSQVEHREFPARPPAMTAIQNHRGVGFELITIPMTPDGPDMDMVEKLVAGRRYHQGHLVRTAVLQPPMAMSTAMKPSAALHP